MESISYQTRKEIKRFCRNLLDCNKELHSKDEADYDSSDYVYSDRNILNKFDNILALLKKERCLEYLSDKEKETSILSLASEIISNVELYRRDSKEIDKKIDTYIENIVKPLDEFEFFIPIKNLSVNSTELKIGNVTIKNFKEVDLMIWIDRDPYIKQLINSL